jgi:hypothetical protein
MPSGSYNSKDVELVIVQMNRRIRTLLSEREAINKRIDTIKKTLVGLATVVGDDVSFSSSNLTCRPRADRTELLGEAELFGEKDKSDKPQAPGAGSGTQQS